MPGAKNTAENMILILTELSDIKTEYILLFQYSTWPIALKRLVDNTSYQLPVGFTDTL